MEQENSTNNYIMERINSLDCKGWYVVGQTLADIRQSCAELPFLPKPDKDYVPSDFLHYLNEVEKSKDVMIKSDIKIQIMTILCTMYHMNDGFVPNPNELTICYPNKRKESIMETKVYGVRIDEVNVNAADIQEMNDEEKWGFVCRNHDEDQVYTLDSFMYYLNADMINTENYFWIAV